MRFFSTLSSVLAAVAALAVAPSNAQTYRPLPFDGRIQSLTLDNIGDTYLLHILTMRPNNTVGNPADYLTINQKGREPPYNGDTGVISVAVDDKAIFKEQYNFRRSELVQFVDANVNGTTVFRASIRAEDEILNKYQWQVFFPESHTWDVYVDFSQSPPQLQFLADNFQLQMQTEFKYKTWYNVAIAIEASGLITFYLSNGDKPVVPVYTTTKPLASVPAIRDALRHAALLADQQPADGRQPPGQAALQRRVGRHQALLILQGRESGSRCPSINPSFDPQEFVSCR